jgi:RNA recognition motif-containing protein
VEMNSRSDGEVAVTKLNNKLYMQQSLVVHEAKG